MATTSSGRSRRPSLWLVSAAAVTAAALLLAAGPARESVAARHPSTTSASRTSASAPAPAVAKVAIDSIAPPDIEARVSADGIERALSSADPGRRDLVLERNLARWVADDPAAAARFAELQSEPFLREAGLRSVAQKWAELDRDAAALWATSLADRTERDQVIEDVALVSSNSDPRASLALLGQRSAEVPRDAARAGVITAWATRDFEGARAWAEAQPPGASRDDIVQRLVFLRAQTDPRAAALLADQLLGDAAARRDAYASIIRAWLERDPEAMKMWAESTDVETRRRIDAELTPH